MDTYFKEQLNRETSAVVNAMNNEKDLFQRTKTISIHEMNLFNSTTGDLTNCDKCKGKGYIAEVEVIRNNIGENSNCYTVVKECNCLTNKIEQTKAKNSGISPLLQKTFSNFIARSDWQQNIKKLAEENAKSKDWFFIGGQSGAGKTHICSAITNFQAKNGVRVKYMTWNEQINQLKDFEDNSFMEQLKRTECLYIDDLFKRPRGENGLPNLSSADIDKTWELINFRYLNKLKTIFSSELILEEIFSLDESLASRIKQNAGKYIVQVKGSGRNLRLI